MLCWRGGVGRGGLTAWWVEQREPVECFRCMGSETKADTEQHKFEFSKEAFSSLSQIVYSHFNWVISFQSFLTTLAH